MHTELYPNLKQMFDYANFEQIAETFEKHFRGLFNLQVLENEAKLGRNDGSYMKFFSLIMEQLKDLYTTGEVSSKLYDILQNDKKIRACFLDRLIFVPPIDGTPSAQLGFLEKTATGELKVAEPVTFLDMLRLTSFLQQLKDGARPRRGVPADNGSVVAVLNLDSIELSDAPKLITSNDALMVNFNRDSRGTPKWGVVDLRVKGNPQVYCETPLLEAEKKEMEERLGFKFREVSPGKSDSLKLTGYLAIAWLSDKILPKSWNFDINADFNVILGDYIFSQFRGDGTGVHFACEGNEYDEYFTPELQQINDECYGGHGDPAKGSKKWGGYSAIKLSATAILATIDGESVPTNDFAKVIKIVGSKKFNGAKFNDLYEECYRTKIPRFSQTIAAFGSPKILNESEEDASVTLTVPESISKFSLRQAHEKACAVTSTNHTLLSFLTPPGSHREWEANAATAIVLTVFRARAKKRVLVVNLPEKFQLLLEEQQFIIGQMQDNPYVTEFKIDTNITNEENKNLSLRNVKKVLLPVFARNRWLAISGYRPPLTDNYWKQAAKYWLIHLNEQTTLLKDREEHKEFKRCVAEMGLKGLQSVLDFLRDEDRELIEGIYGKNKPAFYAACQESELKDYLDALIAHLRNRAFFPFSELGVKYQTRNDAKYLELISEINQLDQFEQVTISDCLSDKDALKRFLGKLTQQARTNSWVSLIVIPELENKDKLNGIYREHRSLYAHLNNVILHNRHVKAAANLVLKIKEASDFKEPSSTKTLKQPKKKTDAPVVEDLSEEIKGAFSNFTGGKKQGPWPIKRGGAVQLQLQQQQEIQQQRQIQQEQQKTQMRTLEEVIVGELVTYDNIDELLKQFFNDFSSENPVNQASALLRVKGESLLKGFFRTWINANPKTAARNVVQSMTLEAAKMLLRKHARFPSGLSLENLPKGFYTQRSKDGALILCYNAEVGYVNGSNPFTVDLNVTIPKAEPWEGDFRLFTIDAYLNKFPPLEERDFQSLLLFAKLQPPKDYKDDFQAFRVANPTINAQIIAADKSGGFFGTLLGGGIKASDKIMKHWLVFLQTWQYEGEPGVAKFLKLEETDLSLNLQEAYKILFAKQSPQIKEWVATTNLSEEHLRAIGQVYYRFGDEMVGLLLTKFRQIDLVLGREFFEAFNNNILSRSENYNCYATQRFFIAMDEMIDRLKGEKPIDAAKRQLWLDIATKHLQIVPWENIETLWRAFDFFLAGITDLGLELQGDEFEKVPAENMLDCMGRILGSLKRIPLQEMKVSFLRKLSARDAFDKPLLDLTNGGVHYAIGHEGFKYFDTDLRLYDFDSGNPTYGPNLKDLYKWGGPETALKIKRTLASCSKFGHKDYEYLKGELDNPSDVSKDSLIWLIFTQFDGGKAQETFKQIASLDSNFRMVIARHLHQAVFVQGNEQINVALGAMVELQAKILNNQTYQNKSTALLNKFPFGTFLEASSILWNAKRWTGFDQLLGLLEAPLVKDYAYPDYLFREAYKLATLFGVTDPEQLKAFFKVTTDLKPVVQNQLRLLISQIMSIDYENSNLANLITPKNWQDLLACIGEMDKDKANASTHRIKLIETLNDHGIRFKYSKTGAFRALKNTEDDKPAELIDFTDHQARLWNFMLAHIAVPANLEPAKVKETMQPMMRFFKKLQLNRTYLNEIEPLLATLEDKDTTKSGTYWTIEYFCQMLQALQPDDANVSFPIPLLKVMIKDINISAKPLDSVEEKFDERLVLPIQTILKNTVFDRDQQSLLCKIALNEFGWQQSSKCLGDIIALLSPDDRALSRGWALDIFAGSKNIHELEGRIEKTRWLLEHSSSLEFVSKNWTKTTALWLKALASRDSEDQLFSRVRNSLTESPQKRTLVLYIIAWSSLNQGLRDSDTFEYELNKKAPKLVDLLSKMSEEDLAILAECYPKQPSPGADDIHRILKQHRTEEVPFKTCVDNFLCHPYPEPRMDYGHVFKTREADLQRMFAETRITTSGENKQTPAEKRPIPAEKAARLSVIFSDLKQLQAGSLLINGTTVPINRLSQAEIASAFKRLSDIAKTNSTNDQVRAQIWALMFEALGRISRKYPHLAQQFALIANDVCIDSPSRVLQLATGEGKSHFVALRAAKHAGMGKTVDVCTAKRTLAERDLEDYQSLFDYLGLTSSYIEARSDNKTYTSTQIHYTTTGDLSLFLDEQSFKGRPIVVPRKDRVALFDEFDFIRFDEGRKTEYNYARPTGKTPKQMTWFYQATNQYYLDKKADIKKDKGDITVERAKDFAEYLVKIAGEDEEKQSLVKGMLQDPLLFVRWLQSAHEADEDELKLGINFTVREENIKVGDTTYPMKEIIPLSTDMQKMAGSTFSAGVQQLLAVRLNTEAKKKGEPQNYHIHPESNIISSQVAAQRMKELWGTWEGFSGTISASQAQTLHTEEGTQVLHIPTNQVDLREWKKPDFSGTTKKGDEALKERIVKVVAQIRQCLKDKKSMLFSCKNDVQVAYLQEQLKQHLTSEELTNFTFYTNEDAASPSKVLADKREQEAWRGGKKQRAVGLVASGFGRGDNVDVEAVFLFNVNDINDLLQKGGRTARNGAEGQVFQFYMMDELKNEEKDLLNVLENSPGCELHAIGNILGSVEGNDEGKKTFDKVMLLREYVFSLQNAANQGYHAGLAQFSTWAMSLLGLFTDQSTSSDFANRVTSYMKILEKCWLDISSETKKNPDQKIRSIEQEMKKLGLKLHKECLDALKGSVTEVKILHINEYPRIKLDMVIEKKIPTDHSTKDLAIVCAIFAGLPVDEKVQTTLARVPEMIDKVAKVSDVLHSFALQVKGCESRSSFVSLLKIALKQAENQSELVKTLKEKVIKSVEPETLLDGVPEGLSKSFLEGIDRLLPEIAKKLIVRTAEKNILSNAERIKSVMPLVTYLGTFTEVEQRKWAPEYILHQDSLLHNTSTEALSERFSCSPMSYRHGDSLWKLANGYALPKDLPRTWKLLQKAVAKDPEQRIRMLSKWEALAGSLDSEQKSAFLINTSKVMTQFSEGKDWDTFTTLLNKTLDSWNKDRKNVDKEGILTLWKQLADNAKRLPALNATLVAGLKLTGTNWFQLLSIYTTLPPKQQVDRQPIFSQVLEHLEPLKMSASEKQVLFQSLIDGFSKREDRVSKEHVLALINEAPAGSFVGEYLNYQILRPDGLGDDLIPLSLQEKLSRDVLHLLKKQKFFTKLQVSERKACLDSINELITSSGAATAEALKTKIDDILNAYKQFLTKLNHEDDLHALVSLPFAVGAQWYLQFSIQHPGARESFRALVADTTSRLSTETLVRELSTRAFTTDECAALLRLAKDERFLNKDFSDSCQHLANVNASLDQMTRLGVEEKARLKKELLELAPKKLKVAIAVFSEHREEIRANPKALNAIIQYGKLNTITASRLGRLSLIMLNALGKEQCSDIKFNNIKRGVDRFMAVAQDTQLDLLLDLMERDKAHTEELLFNNTAVYLHDNVKDGERNLVNGVIDFFYEKATMYQGKPELMFDMKDERLAEMFDFTNKKQAHQNKRVIWMHLLNHHAFVTGSDPDKSHDTHKYQWDIDNNQKLLQMGLECYITRTAEILKPRGRASVLVKRDLNVSQQTALLHLSDELSVIGRPHLDLDARNIPVHTAENVESMHMALGKLIGNYSSSLFKSKERKVQFSKLQDEINLLATGAADVGTVTSRYEKVFLAIKKARLEAMDSDLDVNVSRRAKMNRGGQSRYLNTLNQMQDMVARRWVADLNAVQGFQVYKTYNKQELFELTDRLFKALIQNDDENYPHPGDEKKGKRKPAGFFTTEKTRERLKSLRFELQAFTEDFNSNTIKRPDMEKLLKRLRDDMPKMPGHIAALASEVVNRGDALATHLELELKHSAKPILKG